MGSNLGVVELTVALHYIFNTPQDKILWDVGHQVGYNLFVMLFHFEHRFPLPTQVLTCFVICLLIVLSSQDSNGKKRKDEDIETDQWPLRFHQARRERA